MWQFDLMRDIFNRFWIVPSYHLSCTYFTDVLDHHTKEIFSVPHDTHFFLSLSVACEWTLPFCIMILQYVQFSSGCWLHQQKCNALKRLVSHFLFLGITMPHKSKVLNKYLFVYYFFLASFWVCIQIIFIDLAFSLLWIFNLNFYN